MGTTLEHDSPKYTLPFLVAPTPPAPDHSPPTPHQAPDTASDHSSAMDASTRGAGAPVGCDVYSNSPQPERAPRLSNSPSSPSPLRARTPPAELLPTLFDEMIRRNSASFVSPVLGSAGDAAAGPPQAARTSAAAGAGPTSNSPAVYWSHRVPELQEAPHTPRGRGGGGAEGAETKLASAKRRKGGLLGWLGRRGKAGSPAARAALSVGAGPWQGLCDGASVCEAVLASPLRFPPRRLLLTPPPRALGVVVAQGWLEECVASGGGGAGCGGGAAHLSEWRWCVLAADQLRGFGTLDDLYNGEKALVHFRLFGTELLPPSAKQPLRLVIHSKKTKASTVFAAPSLHARSMWARSLSAAASEPPVRTSSSSPAASSSQARPAEPLADPFDDDDGAWGEPLRRKPTNRFSAKPAKVVKVEQKAAADARRAESAEKRRGGSKKGGLKKVDPKEVQTLFKAAKIED